MLNNNHKNKSRGNYSVFCFFRHRCNLWLVFDYFDGKTLCERLIANLHVAISWNPWWSWFARFIVYIYYKSNSAIVFFNTVQFFINSTVSVLILLHRRLAILIPFFPLNSDKRYWCTQGPGCYAIWFPLIYPWEINQRW